MGFSGNKILNLYLYLYPRRVVFIELWSLVLNAEYATKTQSRKPAKFLLITVMLAYRGIMLDHERPRRQANQRRPI